jgi:tetratricopeptide (TPR) repeat protein
MNHGPDTTPRQSYRSNPKTVPRPDLTPKRLATALLVLLLVLPLAAAALPALGDTGEAGPPMLKMTYGSRALALGGAFVGVADDVYYMDANPGGGEATKVLKVSLLHQEWIDEVNYEAIRIGRGLGKRLYWGLGFTYLYLPFTYYNYYGEAVGGSVNISQALGTLNFGYQFRKLPLSVGTNLKVLYDTAPTEILEARYGSSYTDQNYLLFAGDLGLFARTNLLKTYIGPEPSLMFGITLKNVGYSPAVDTLPTELQAGVSYRLFWHLLLTAQLNYPLYEPLYGAAGLEFDIAKKLFFQAGLRISENPMLAVGFGYKWRDIELNVSYTPRIEFPNVFSVSLNFFFGETKSRRRNERITSLLIRALEQFEDGNYDEAMESAEQVLAIDPKNELALSLQDTIESIRKVEENGK